MSYVNVQRWHENVVKYDIMIINYSVNEAKPKLNLEPHLSMHTSLTSAVSALWFWLPCCSNHNPTRPLLVTLKCSLVPLIQLSSHPPSHFTASSVDAWPCPITPSGSPAAWHHKLDSGGDFGFFFSFSVALNLNHKHPVLAQTSINLMYFSVLNQHFVSLHVIMLTPQ